MREPRPIMAFGLATLAVAFLAAPLVPPARAHSGMILLALDTSGNGNDLEPINAYRAPAATIKNNAMTFNGTSSYLQRVHGGAIISNTKMTVCLWAKSNTDTGEHVLIYQDGGFYLNQSGTDVVAEVRWSSGGSGGTLDTQTTIATGVLLLGVWRHICYVVDNTASANTATTFTIYVDAAVAAQTSRLTGTGEMVSAKTNLFFGGVPSGTGLQKPFHGWLDDTVWCAAFTASATQIETIRTTSGNNNPGAPCGSTLKGLWKYDELVTGASTSAPASGYIDPVNVVGEAPYTRWMHVRGDSATLEMRIDFDGDDVVDRVVTGNVWDERVTWTTVGTHLFHVQFIDQFGRAQFNETPITIVAPTGSGVTLRPSDTAGGYPLTRTVSVEGDSRVVRIKVDFDGDGQYERDVQSSAFGETYTWATPGVYRLNVEAANDAGVSVYRESIITVTEGPAPTAIVYPADGTRDHAPLTRWVVVRGDESVRAIRIDFTGDGTWDHAATARSTTVEHTWPTPGIHRLVVQLETADGTLGVVEHRLRVENTLVQDPLTSTRTCPFCGFGGSGTRWGNMDPTFTPQEVWSWIVFLGLCAIAAFILYVRLARGGA